MIQVRPPIVIVPEVGAESMRVSLVRDEGELKAHVRINHHTVLIGGASAILSELCRISDALGMAIEVEDPPNPAMEICGYIYTTEDEGACIVGTRAQHEDGGESWSHDFVPSGRYLG